MLRAPPGTSRTEALLPYTTLFRSAKGRVLAKVSRQHLAEQLLPTVLSLKHTLEGCKSSLQRDLMSYLAYVNHNYKEEMSQVLSSDPVLKQEIEYDMKIGRAHV